MIVCVNLNLLCFCTPVVHKFCGSKVVRDSKAWKIPRSCHTEPKYAIGLNFGLRPAPLILISVVFDLTKPEAIEAHLRRLITRFQRRSCH